MFDKGNDKLARAMLDAIDAESLGIETYDRLATQYRSWLVFNEVKP
ncbi:MAG: hypothetical protein JO188_04945 [Hyphomicrobiales bacterium]|nr:hypothetical protein [Hyphomicrobiales bacterium]